MVRKSDASLQYCFSEIKNYPVLPSEEQKALAVLAKKGDALARDKLIVSNMRLVMQLVNGYDPKPEIKNDLLSAGAEGLLQAIKKYNPRQGVNFMSYAIWWVHRCIIETLREEPILHIRAGERVTLKKVYATIDRFVQDHHREPSVQEIADILPSYTPPRKYRPMVNRTGNSKEYLRASVNMRAKVNERSRAELDAEKGNPANGLSKNVSPYFVSRALERHAMAQPKRLDDIIGPESSTTLLETIPDTASLLPDEAVSRDYSAQRVRKIIASLGDKRMEKIIDMRFYENKTLQEIGDEMDLTRERVRQIEAKALRMLKRKMEKSEFNDGKL